MEIVKERKTRGVGRPQNVHASLKISKRRPQVLIDPGTKSWIIGESSHNPSPDLSPSLPDKLPKRSPTNLEALGTARANGSPDRNDR